MKNKQIFLNIAVVISFVALCVIVAVFVSRWHNNTGTLYDNTTVQHNSSIENTSTTITNEQAKENFNPKNPTYAAGDTGLIECYLRRFPEAAKYLPEGAFRQALVSNSSDPIYGPVCSDSHIDTPELSERARMLLTTDADKDGLNLYLENTVYSDDQKADTDGDGSTDLAEVLTGQSPVGAGVLVQTRP